MTKECQMHNDTCPAVRLIQAGRLAFRLWHSFGISNSTFGIVRPECPLAEIAVSEIG